MRELQKDKNNEFVSEKDIFELLEEFESKCHLMLNCSDCILIKNGEDFRSVNECKAVFLYENIFKTK